MPSVKSRVPPSSDGLEIERDVFPETEGHAGCVRDSLHRPIRLEKQRRFMARPGIAELTGLSVYRAVQCGHELGGFLEPGDVTIYISEHLAGIGASIGFGHDQGMCPRHRAAGTLVGHITDDTPTCAR
jgi:hypothetical protein